MAQRYPERVDLAAMVALLRRYVPQLPNYAAQVQLAERADAQVAGAAQAFAPSQRPDLTPLFAHIATLAMVHGMLADLPGLAQVLPIAQEPWYAAAYAQSQAAS